MLLADSIRAPLDRAAIAGGGGLRDRDAAGGREPRSSTGSAPRWRRFAARWPAGLAGAGLSNVRIRARPTRRLSRRPGDPGGARRAGTALRRADARPAFADASPVPCRSGRRRTSPARSLVSQSTFRILQALYDVRLRIFEIVVASMLAAAHPHAWRVGDDRQADRPAAARSDGARRAPQRLLPGRFRDADRRDEIGDLARALGELTRRLDEHIQLLESFAGGRVARIQESAGVDSSRRPKCWRMPRLPTERDRFLGMMTKDVDRLERLVSGVRELARIDAQLAHEAQTTIDVQALLSEIVDGLRLSGSGPVTLSAAGAPASWRVRASPIGWRRCSRTSCRTRAASPTGKPDRHLARWRARFVPRRCRGPWSGHTAGPPRVRVRSLLHLPA